ncbi:APC family permease [Aquibacillus sp. 3ASR75-11]|uniref:APC family permease n=1 Tax=Terrihalobacillus insolitus TaxID=2950438 RepID=A0A9X3WSQ8_9BACI|nr:APC family permease [Terrihalobacillus insolitus]MDC3414063.1 APC family permease [Terrihalobacillus insolitus]MDC3424153.1 APC family permease [Terrihalobacillus insolitus]
MEERNELKKTLKPHWVWAIAFGSAVGWGAFVLPVDWMATAGPLGVIIGFSIGALLMIIIGVSYGYLIEKIPVSGGEFAYAYYGFGRYHAYLCGWFLTLGYMSIVALNASALALLAKFVLPSFAMQGLMYNIAGWDVYFGEVLIATIALIAFAYLNIRGTKLSGFSQFVFCITLIVGVVLLTISMILHPSSSFTNIQPFFNPGVSAFAAIIAIVAISPWAYVGFDNIPQAAEEFNFSPKKAFKLIVIALICAAITYSLTIIATAVAMPWQTLVNQETIWGTGDVVNNAYGIVGVLLLSLSLCMGIFTGLNGFYVSTSRLLFAMGRANILPRAFAKLHPKYATPYVGIIFTCIITLFAPFFGRQALLWVVDMSAIGVTIAYFYCCAVAYKLFRWSESTGDSALLVSPTKKFITLLGVISSIGFFLLLVVPGSPGFLGTPSWIALLVWVALGLIFYAVKRKELASIPKETLDYNVFGKTLDNSGHTEEKKNDFAKIDA